MEFDEIPIITTVRELRALRSSFTKNNESVGFVPTMGYLHQGHMSLVNESLNSNDHTIISIFVNPSQFAPGEDLETYPRDLDHDLKIINEFIKQKFSNDKTKKWKIDAIFKPEVSEMYPSGFVMDRVNQKGTFVEVLGVSEQLEGKTRPSFFRGVSTVVTKLLNAVEPTVAYFGQKDIQQTVVIKNMVIDLLINTKIEIVPIIRNESGLALSSRNAYLSNEILNQVTCIYQSMKLAFDQYSNKNILNIDTLTKLITDLIESTNSNFKIDYVSFNHPTSLEYITAIDPKIGCILSMAVYVPNSVDENEEKTTRLIDNMIFPAIK